MAISWGYGDKHTGDGSKGYGDHQYGYGHPQQTLVVVLADGPYRHDQGGELCRFEAATAGSLPPGPYTVTIGGKPCYSGIQGQGTDVYPDETGSYFEVRTPHLYGLEGSRDLKITGAFGSKTFTAAVFIVQHTGHSGVSQFMSRWPRDVWLLREARARS